MPVDEAIVETEAPLVVLAEFEGAYDAQTEEFSLTALPPSEWSVVESVELPDGSFRQVSQPLWCSLQINPTGGIVLNTVTGSLYTTPAGCGFNPLAFPYIDSGMICATVSLLSRYPSSLSDVHAQITQISAAGYEGYRYIDETCCGTGANPALAPNGPGKPSDLLGLWRYGTVARNTDVRRVWSFQNAGGNFTFRGVMVGTFTEQCDGLDNDCDRRVDEGANCYADGLPCVDGSDCRSGVCSDGRCGLSTVGASNVVQVGGAGTMNSAGHSATVRVGPPAPVGGAAAPGGSAVRLGPPTP